MDNVRFGVKLCACGVNIAESMTSCTSCEIKELKAEITQLKATIFRLKLIRRPYV